MNFANGETITRLRSTFVVDEMGDLVPTGVPDELAIPGCAVGPRSSADLTEPARQGVIVGLSVYVLDPEADINPLTDQIRYRGDLYDIDGDVGRWQSPFAGPGVAGLEFALRRAIA